MFKNYLKVALNNLWNQKIYSLINIVGLSVGMAACILILLYVQHETNYDTYHEKGDRLYRLHISYKNSGGAFQKGIWTPFILAPTMESIFEGQIEEVVRIALGERALIQYGDQTFLEPDVTFADPNIFEAFSFKLLKGDPKTALVEPFTMVVSESFAKKYFGDEDPMGKILKVEERLDVQVTGVMEDMPKNTHFHFDAFGSLATGELIYPERVKTQWGEGSQATYVLLEEGVNLEDVTSQFPDFIEEHAFGEDASEFVKYELMPVEDIHLHSHMQNEMGSNGDIAYVYIFSAVAFIIILIASINYMNLATARSAERSREVGLRKVVGAYRSQIIVQFLSESLLLTLFAMVLALLWAEMLLPVFNDLAGKSLEINLLSNPSLLIGLVLITLLTGILSGSYPALFLSAFRPVKVLKGDKGTSAGGSMLLRKGLVVVQFSISTILIIGSLIVSGQLNFLQSKKLGIETDQVVIVPFADSTMVREYLSVKEQLLQQPEILSVTASNKRMTRSLSSNLDYKVDGMTPPPNGHENFGITTLATDHDFFKAYDVKFVEGRDFDVNNPADLNHAFIFNESAIERMGLEDPIGKRVQGSVFDIDIMDFVQKEGEIIGVVEDFHFESLHQAITPVAYQLSDDWLNWLSIKIKAGETQKALNLLENLYKEYAPLRPFSYTFLDEDIQALYQSEKRFLNIFSYFAGLAVLIACLGIFGLASFTAERRTKEIGVRKVLGASSSNITFLITKDFAFLVLISALIGWPVAWWAMSTWLQDFTYRIEIGWGTFLLATLMALAIALLTVSSQAIRAARSNPVDALKYE